MNGLLAGLGMLGAAMLAGNNSFHAQRYTRAFVGARRNTDELERLLKLGVCGHDTRESLRNSIRYVGEAIAHYNSIDKIDEKPPSHKLFVVEERLEKLIEDFQLVCRKPTLTGR